MTVTVKICGLSTLETLDAALHGGASHVGLVFFPKSPRHVAIDRAASLAHHARGKTKIVGLFVNPAPDYIAAVRAQVPLDIIQLHGDEPPALVSSLRAAQQLDIWKAIPVQSAQDVRDASRYMGAAQLLLYDAKPPSDAMLPGGTGLRFDWRILDGASHSLPWALAGGLTAESLPEAVRLTGATLLDVSSGVESAPGIKDVDKISRLLKAAADL